MDARNKVEFLSDAINWIWNNTMEYIDFYISLHKDIIMQDRNGRQGSERSHKQ